MADINVGVVEILNQAAFLVCLIAKAVLFLYGSYIFYISIFAWRKKGKKSIDDYKPSNSFAIIIAAHDEENVISNLIHSLKQLDYPANLYNIYVVADNCTDKTALIAKKSGAVVYERFNEYAKSKGFALKWIFNKLLSINKDYDAICVIDADNIVSSNFLKEMDMKLQEGFKIVQGYRDIKNPFDSWITKSYAITYWLSNRLFQLPRYYTGLSCVLTGSGYVVKTEALREIGWDISSITEDTEFTFKAALKGIKIGWAHNAVIYDEQPIKLSTSWIQRKRWLQGHAYCAMRYTKDLFIKLFRDRSIMTFDSFIYLLYPFIAVFSCFTSVLDMYYFLVNFNTLGIFKYFYLISLPAFYIIEFTYFLVFIKLESKLSIRILKGFISYPIFCLTWIPIIIHGFLDRNNSKWIRIPHTRNLSINELEKQIGM